MMHIELMFCPRPDVSSTNIVMVASFFNEDCDGLPDAVTAPFKNMSSMKLPASAYCKMFLDLAIAMEEKELSK